MNLYKNRKVYAGFTLIELLVVIAIIGLLSSIVLASLSTARTKGKDASVISTMSNMRAQAELFYSTNSNRYASADYATNPCTVSPSATINVFNNGTNNLITLLNGVSNELAGFLASNSRCQARSTDWGMVVKMPGNEYFCVDSKGKASNKNSSGVLYATLDSAMTATDFACN